MQSVSSKKNNGIIWQWFFPLIGITVWLLISAIFVVFWQHTVDAQRASWAGVLLIWFLLSPYLAIFILCVLTLTLANRGAVTFPEHAAQLAYIITKYCVLPDSVLNRLNLGFLTNLSSIPGLLYSTVLVANGKISTALNLSLERLSSVQAGGGSVRQKSSALADVAQMRYVSGDLKTAQEEAKKALQMLTAERQDLFTIMLQNKILGTLASMHGTCHDFHMSKTLYLKANALMVAVQGNPPKPALQNVFRGLIKANNASLANILVWADDYQSAEQQLKEFQSADDGPCQNMLDLSALAALGEMQLRKGEMEEAKQTIAKAKPLARPVDSLIALDTVKVQAHYYMLTGDLDESRKLLAQCSATVKRLVGEEHQFMLDVLQLQSKLAEKAGDPILAATYTRQFADLKSRCFEQLYPRAIQ